MHRIVGCMERNRKRRSTIGLPASAGNLLDWHPHVHLLVSWGLFRRDGSFIPVEGTPDPETVAQLFRHKVLRMLLDEGAIEETVVQNLLAWPHTGFGTHVSRVIPGTGQSPIARSARGSIPWPARSFAAWIPTVPPAPSPHHQEIAQPADLTLPTPRQREPEAQAGL